MLKKATFNHGKSFMRAACDLNSITFLLEKKYANGEMHGNKKETMNANLIEICDQMVPSFELALNTLNTFNTNR